MWTDENTPCAEAKTGRTHAQAAVAHCAAASQHQTPSTAWLGKSGQKRSPRSGEQEGVPDSAKLVRVSEQNHKKHTFLQERSGLC